MNIMRSAAAMAVLVAVVVGMASAQAPAPGPATDPCITATYGLVNTCGAFVGAVGATAAKLTNATNAQVSVAVANLTTKPTSQCCVFYSTDYLAQGCNCNPAVLALSAQQGTSAQSVATQTRVWKAACSIPNSSDRCLIAAAAPA